MGRPSVRSAWRATTRAMTTAGYNRRHCMKRSRRFTAQLAACFFLLLAWTPLCLAGDDVDTASADLARQIAGLTGPGVISLTIRNNSSMAADEIPVVQRALINGLSNLGVNVRERADAATVVRVTLSQTARQGIWVAEVRQGPEVRVAMVRVASAAPAGKPQETAMTLRKTLLISEAEPILDAELIALPGDSAAARHLVVLSPERVTIYRRDEKAAGGWVEEQSAPIAHGRAYPRDVRGRLEADAAGLFRAYLPGVICTASQPAATGGPGVSLVCADSDDPWPVGSRKAVYNSSRNYFTGVTMPSLGPGLEPFYSAAELVQRRGTTTVYSEVGGQFRVYDGVSLKTLAGSRDWGSDAAGIASGCGSGAQLLVTSSSGDGVDDSLLAYEVEGRSAIAASAPLPLDGEVTAMWAMRSEMPDATSTVTIVLEKKQPLEYEAYSVSVACNQ